MPFFPQRSSAPRPARSAGRLPNIKALVITTGVAAVIVGALFFAAGHGGFGLWLAGFIPFVWGVMWLLRNRFKPGLVAVGVGMVLGVVGLSTLPPPPVTAPAQAGFSPSITLSPAAPTQGATPTPAAEEPVQARALAPGTAQATNTAVQHSASASTRATTIPAVTGPATNRSTAATTPPATTGPALTHFDGTTPTNTRPASSPAATSPAATKPTAASPAPSATPATTRAPTKQPAPDFYLDCVKAQKLGAASGLPRDIVRDVIDCEQWGDIAPLP